MGKRDGPQALRRTAGRAAARSYLAEYERRIACAYPARADGKLLLAFPRLFIVARRKDEVTAAHPRDILLGAQGRTGMLPVCDHYSGVEARMRKSLALQHEMTQEFGACVFDVTLDCEDGAPVGGEAEHAALVVPLALGARPDARVAVRVHPVDHPAFESDIATIAGQGRPPPGATSCCPRWSAWRTSSALPVRSTPPVRSSCRCKG